MGFINQELELKKDFAYWQKKLGKQNNWYNHTKHF